MIRKMQAFLIIAIILSCQTTNAQYSKKDGLLLRLNLKTGEGFTLNMKMENEIQFQAGDTPATMLQKVESRIHSEVTNHTDEEITFNNTILRMAMDQKVMGMEMRYDSDKPEEVPAGPSAQLAENLKKFINLEFISVFDPQANLISENLKDKALQTGANMDQMDNMNGSNTFANFPENKVMIGDSWTSVNVRNGVEVSTEYTLKGIKGKLAEVYTKSTLTKSGDENPEIISMEGTQEGMINIHMPTGITKSGTIKQNFDMKVSERGMEVPMRLFGEIVIESEIDN